MKLQTPWKLRLLLLILCVLLAATPSAWAQATLAIEATPNARPLAVDRGAAAVWQSLLKLRTRASLIMITAHPDDEDGGMLAYESRGEGARVAMLTLNRGEGGQNAMSPDYFDAMGLVRTEELLASDRYYGARQYFTRVCDFGFSKTRQQTLDEWTLNRVLYDAVRVVRMTRPLVVTSVFVGGPTDGHGNHQVAGEVAQLVYKMAGDPNVFPDQIKQGLRPWKPLKDYARAPFFTPSAKGIYDYADRRYYPVRFFSYIKNQWTNGPLAPNVEIPEGNYAPVIGLSYRQISAIGWGLQKSQYGGGSIPFAGPSMSSYHRFASRVATTDHESSYFAGIDTSLMGIADLAPEQDTAFLKQSLGKLSRLVDEATARFSAQHPEIIAPILAQGLKETDTLIQQVAASNLTSLARFNINHELRVKQSQFNAALAEALGLEIDATVAPAKSPTGRQARRIQPSFIVAIPGQTFWVRVHAADQGSTPVELSSIWLRASEGGDWDAIAEGSATGLLGGGQARDVRFKVAVPVNAPFTKPYFSRPDIEQPYYNILNPKYLNLPFKPYPLAAWAEFTFDGVPFELAKDVQTVRRVTGPGTVLNPLVVGPAISVAISPRAGVVPLGEHSFNVEVLIHSNVKGPAQGSVRLELPPGWRSNPSRAAFAMARDGQDSPLKFQVIPSQLSARPYTLTALADYAGHEYKEGYRKVGYIGLRPYFLYRLSTYQTQGVDVKVAPGLNVGYVTGTGDSLPQSLENLGIHVQFLTAADLAGGDLSKFNVILIGERAYSVRDDLRTYNHRLLDYVHQGGVVVVQYQAPDYNHDYGPFPYDLSGNPEVVMDVHSKVTELNPESPVMTWPNVITTRDFEGWVEERGHGFMNSWDPRYKALLSTNDPGQAPQKGGLLVARYGKGTYIYCAYAFYRELPEGVPGAYRLFANLLSLGKNAHGSDPLARGKRLTGARLHPILSRH